MVKPLRPELYHRLNDMPGLGGVVIANEGDEMRARVEPDPETGRPRMELDWPGEYYRVNCLWCNDTRHRLWINHRWGLWVPQLKSDNLWLAVCYNQNCLATPGRARALANMVFHDFARGRRPDPVLPGRPPPAGAQQPREVVPAGPEMYELHRLPLYHPAVEYVRSRGYDHVWLGQTHQVSYCEAARPEFPLVNRRLVIPVYMFGRLVGWQARHLGEPPDGVPRYWTMPGMKKSRVLYNYDTARGSDFVVVTEGPTKVWSVGDFAVATLGDTVSSFQVQLLMTWKTVVIYLDGKAERKAQGLYDELRRFPDVKRVLIRLPHDREPGDYTVRENRALIKSEAARQGVELPTGI
jgi:hypothetical protein